jgi:hypothetical protein
MSLLILFKGGSTAYNQSLDATTSANSATLTRTVSKALTAVGSSNTAIIAKLIGRSIVADSAAATGTFIKRAGKNLVGIADSHSGDISKQTEKILADISRNLLVHPDDFSTTTTSAGVPEVWRRHNMSVAPATGPDGSNTAVQLTMLDPDGGFPFLAQFTPNTVALQQGDTSVSVWVKADGMNGVEIFNDTVDFWVNLLDGTITDYNEYGTLSATAQSDDWWLITATADQDWDIGTSSQLTIYALDETGNIPASGGGSLLIWHPQQERASAPTDWQTNPLPIETSTSVGSFAKATGKALDATANAATSMSPTELRFWTDSDPTGLLSSSDSAAVTLSNRFYSDADGYVTGIRFYKGSGNTGEHIGLLWDESGAELARVTFTDESGSGWQQANFATPIPITGANVYVYGYFAPNGGYAYEGGYDWSSIHVDPLHFTTVNPSVFAYGSTPTFWNETYLQSNYSIDVLFHAQPTESILSRLTSKVLSAVGASASVDFVTDLIALFHEYILDLTATMSAASASFAKRTNKLVTATTEAASGTVSKAIQRALTAILSALSVTITKSSTTTLEATASALSGSVTKRTSKVLSAVTTAFSVSFLTEYLRAIFERWIAFITQQSEASAVITVEATPIATITAAQAASAVITAAIPTAIITEIRPTATIEVL